MSSDREITRAWKVTVRNGSEKKIDVIHAKTAHSALNKIQRAPKGWHWNECSYEHRSKQSSWCASVRAENKHYNFVIEDNG